jgi:hypothetical protein
LTIKKDLLKLIKKISKLEATTAYLMYEEAFNDLVKKYNLNYKKVEGLDIESLYEKEFSKLGDGS